MINSGAFAYVNLLSASADYAYTRNEVLSSNISNVDTPNYKRQDVSFETALKAVISKADASSLNLTQVVRNLDYSSLQPIIYTDNAELSYRLDGNNVDIDTEEVELASNQYYYQGLIDGMKQNFNRISSALAT